MGTRVNSIGVTVIGNDSDISAREVKSEENTTINFSSSEGNEFLSDYETNSKNNLFLKEYLEGKAASEGVQIPSGMKINISSFKFDSKQRLNLSLIESEKFWEDFWKDIKNLIPGKDDAYTKIEEYLDKKGITGEEKEKILEMYLFNDVRVNIYKSRIQDMFNLFAKDKNTVKEKVEKMQLTDEEKNKIIKLKEFFDKYYKVEAEYNGKTYDLLHLSKTDKEELNEISPDFAKFIEKEQPTLKKHALDFAGKELKAEELDDSAGVSKIGAAALMLGLIVANVGKGVWDSRQLKKSLKKSEIFMKYLKEHPNEAEKIVAEATKRYNRVLGGERGLELAGRYMKRIGFEGGEHLIAQRAIFKAGMPKWINPLKAFKYAKGGALLALILTTLQGAGDDCAGAVKDFMQDQNNFGWKTAGVIGGAAILGGVLSSMLVAPTINGIVDYKRAEKAMIKNGFAQKARGLTKFKNMGKIGLFGALFGMLVASSSSGSSWTSMFGTGLKMKLNGNELEKKGMITDEENTHKTTFNNMMEYEAYKGKLYGITVGDVHSGVLTGDWTIGMIGGGAGLFTHTNPYVQSLSFGLQGCSETLTACGYQLAGSKVRNNSIDKDKQALVDSVKKGIQR